MRVFIVIDRDNNIFNVADSQEMADHLISLQPNIVEPQVKKYGIWNSETYDVFYTQVFARRLAEQQAGIDEAPRAIREGHEE